MNDASRVRKRQIISARTPRHIRIAHECMLNFASNDYLGLAQDARVKEAFIEGVREFGFGSGSSAMICGYTHLHRALEEQFADFLGRERAILFNSGYHANLGVITTFANRHTTVVADKHCHASMIDAVTLSRAKLQRYHHQDVEHAAALLQPSSLCITESVFSMTGALSPARDFALEAKAQQSLFIVDDAHGFGVLGSTGRGVCEQFHLSEELVPILVTPLGKALGGVGAIVSGPHDMMETLLQNARTYFYTTALPPAVCAAALQALTIIRTESWRLTKLRTLIDCFHREAEARGIQLIAKDSTPIKCIIYGSNVRTLAMQEKLREHGMLVAAIRPPTVPQGKARIRISLNADMQEADIVSLLDLLVDAHAH